jgi:acyl-CoA dehydrogenase
MQINHTAFRDDHEMLRTTARRFLERECAPKL